MSKMKQLWYTKKVEKLRDCVELREVDIPEVGVGEVKVKIAYAALCATDIHQVTLEVFGAKPPAPLGHECSGVIVEVGADVEKYGFKVGDKVSMCPVSSCGLCLNCKKGHRQYCMNPKLTKAFSEYVVCDVSALNKIPDDADLQKYCLVEPASCTLRAMDLAPIPHGATVAVSGVGGIGSILLNHVILSGAAKITAIEPVAQKRELALSMGAQYAIDPFNEDTVARAMQITEGQGFDFVFEVSGSPKAAEAPLKMMARCGTVVYFAVFPPKYEMPLNLYDLYMKEGRIQTVFCDPTNMRRTIDLMPRMQTEKIIGKVMPLSQAPDAFELFEQSIYPKILLDCSK